jgi:Ca2+-binding RTX toxin-like protein
MPVPPLLRPLLLACLLLALCAGPAGAASVSVTDGVLSVTGGAWESNTITLRAGDAGAVVVEDGAGITAALPACTVAGAAAACSGVTRISVSAGDGADVVTVADGLVLPVSVSDGSSNDTVRGGGGPLTVVNGSGNDSFTAGHGGATFATGSGRDVFVGGAGPDTVDYAAATRRVTVSADGVANDGVSNEQDDVRSGIDRIVGSPYGGDRLTGGAGDERLEGGAGDDVLVGGLGADRLEGGLGVDRITGDRGADHFVAKASEIVDMTATEGDTGDLIPESTAQRH